MKFLKRVNSKKVLSVLDFGAEKVRVLIAEKNKDPSFRVLGAGESLAQGIDHGQIIHLGDAVESVVEAVRKAEASSDLAIGTLYCNYDDGRMESVRSKGSLVLRGEGQIRPEDVRKACVTAARLTDDFGKNVLYARELNFLIDGRDEVLRPENVFAEKLEARVHLLMSRADHYERWQSLMERSAIRRAVPVVSAWSTAYAILPGPERAGPGLILDLGRDFLNIFIFRNNMISDYRALLTQSFPTGAPAPGGLHETLADLIKEWAPRVWPATEALVTGDLADDPNFLACLEKLSILPLRRLSPRGVEALSQPSLSSLVGLLFVAAELENGRSFLLPDKGFLESARDRVTSFVREYF